MSYAWIIDSDNLDFPGDAGYVYQSGWDGLDKVLIGPCGVSMDDTEKLATTKVGEVFRMSDDDGEVYYTGRIIGEYDGFEPLDDFGMPNAGCTSIEYRDSKGRWNQL